MATVTFPIELGGSGLVVSDDTDPTTGLRNGGYLTRFVPALQQTVAVAGFVVGQVTNAAASASAAAGSASAASSSASSAASSAASAATLYDQFDDRYLGPKASNPTVDNDGNALLVGAMYFNTSALETRVWNGTTWQTASVNGGTVNSLIVTGALQYQGTLTGGTGVINIGSGQLVKDEAGDIGINVAAPTSRLTIGQGTFDAAASGTSGLYTAASGLLTLLSDGLDISNRAGVNRFTLDPAGNAGLGVTPSEWGVAFKSLDIFGGSFSATSAQSYVGNNSFFDGTNFVYKTTNFASLYEQNSGNNGGQAWFTAPSGIAGNPITFTQAMTLTNGGNLLVGTTADNGNKFSVSQTNAPQGIVAAILNSGTGGAFVNITETGVANWAVGQPAGSGALAFVLGRNTVDAGTEAARITSARYFKASNTGVYGNAAGSADLTSNTTHHFQNDANNYVVIALANNTGASAGAFLSLLPTGAIADHYQGRVNNVEVYKVLSNGNVQNTNNSYGAISDPKLKDIIGPKSSTWEKTKQYNWIEYYLKSDTEHTFKMLGLNAEEAAAVSPGVVDESPDLVEVTKVRQVPVRIVRLDENENPIVDEETGEVIYDEVLVDEEYTEWEPNGEFTKSLKYSVVSMQYHRTTQECQQRIESLEAAKVQADDLIQQIMARVAALESASA